MDVATQKVVIKSYIFQLEVDFWKMLLWGEMYVGSWSFISQDVVLMLEIDFIIFNILMLDDEINIREPYSSAPEDS